MATRPVCQFSCGALPCRASVAAHEVLQHRYDVDRILGQS
jgi:hypothetical protein